MSKICRTFAPEFQKIMKKMQYIQPKMESIEILSESMMLPESPGSTYNPAPERGGYSPVPGNE